MSIELIHEGPVSIVTLNTPPMNLLEIETMDLLVDLHREADAHPESRVIVTRSAVPNMFSNGLNPQYVLAMSPEARVDIFRAVGRMLHGLFSLGKPHIAVVNGPAMAGGAILALTADFRLMEAEHGRLCFSEPKVGLPIPQPVARIIAHFCLPAMLREVVLLGKNMDAHTARETGLVDATAEGTEALEELVKNQVARLARLSPAVLRSTKAGMRSHLRELTAQFADDLGEFANFTGPDFLGEGLTALMEQRHPIFKR